MIIHWTAREFDANQVFDPYISTFVSNATASEAVEITDKYQGFIGLNIGKVGRLGSIILVIINCAHSVPTI